jgi:hypothetical protein
MGHRLAQINTDNLKKLQEPGVRIEDFPDVALHRARKMPAYLR